MSDTLFSAHGVIKEFSGVRVLNEIGFDIAPGEVLGIIGENGAGKSTLIKIICGVYQPTAGTLSMHGETVTVNSPLRGKQLGIGMVPQEFNLIGTLSVFENIYLGSELRKGPFLDKPAMRARTRQLLDELGSGISPDALVNELSTAQKQMVEIAKALTLDSRLLILDEPTTVLTKDEVAVLFDRVRNLTAKGVSVIFISHKLTEVKDICDRVMVLRDGEHISTDPTDELTEHEMALRMVGRELTQLFPDKTEPTDAPALEVSGLNVDGAVSDVFFTLNKGEVLGIAGLLGSGQTEMAEAIMGLVRASSGAIKVEGQPTTIRKPSQAVDAGIAYLSDDRQGKGLVLGFDIPENVTLISLKNYGRVLLDRKAENAKSDEYVKAFNVRAASLKSQLQFLSGGNQQKVYLAKWMDTDPKILILNEPTRGIDVNAKSEIYHFVNGLAKQGIGCLLISSEMEEILGLCSRVLVMREGTIRGELSGDKITEENIMLYAAGLAPETAPEATAQAINGADAS